jgi:hypothetical protein
MLIRVRIHIYRWLIQSLLEQLKSSDGTKSYSYRHEYICANIKESKILLFFACRICAIHILLYVSVFLLGSLHVFPSPSSAASLCLRLPTRSICCWSAVLVVLPPGRRTQLPPPRTHTTPKVASVLTKLPCLRPTHATPSAYPAQAELELPQWDGGKGREERERRGEGVPREEGVR